MSQDTFSLYLQDALKQAEPQMLLLVFVRVELAADASDEQRLAFANGVGGKLRPVSCVNKQPSELTDFNALNQLSGQTVRPWDMVFIASITGPDSQLPISEEIEKWLRLMVDSIVAGNVKQFLALDRQGKRLTFD